MSDCATPKIVFETPTALPLEDAFDGGPTSRFCSPARASEVALGLRHEAISPIYRNLRPRLLLRQALHILGVLLRLGLAFEATGGHVADFAEDGTRRRCGLGAGRLVFPPGLSRRRCSRGSGHTAAPTPSDRRNVLRLGRDIRLPGRTADHGVERGSLCLCAQGSRA